MLLVAHDTNIAYLPIMPGFGWKLGNYLENNILPADTLQLERYKHLNSGEYFLRIVFETQSMAQIRNLSSLSNNQTPLQQDFEAARTAEQAAPDCSAHLPRPFSLPKKHWSERTNALSLQISNARPDE